MQCGVDTGCKISARATEKVVDGGGCSMYSAAEVSGGTQGPEFQLKVVSGNSRP